MGVTGSVRRCFYCTLSHLPLTAWGIAKSTALPFLRQALDLRAANEAATATTTWPRRRLSREKVVSAVAAAAAHLQPAGGRGLLALPLYIPVWAGKLSHSSFCYVVTPLHLP